jgi:hypothetical protein
VGGNLDLGSLTSIPEGFNPTVGGYLYLRSLTSIPEGFNPTVGGNLYLGSLTSIPEGFNPTVGGNLDLGSGLKCDKTAPSKKNNPKNKLLVWQGGEYVSADGILTRVVSKKGNVYKVKKIHSTKEFYLVTDGLNTHAHGDTLKEAKDDFRFKKMAETLKNEPINENTVITSQYYHVITGACNRGINEFINENFTGKKKEQILKSGIKAKELFPILKKKNAYGFDRFNSLITFKF